VEAFCTNRALPLRLKKRRGYVELEDHSGAPVTSVRCVAGPTPPRTAAVVGDAAWGLISHLSLDFLTLATRAGAGASALRQLLQLYSSLCSVEHRAQLAGVVGVETRGVVRPLPFPGPIAFGRGLEVNVTCDESAFTGSGVFLLGAVLARFFTKYASINSFTETVLTTQQRGEVTRWPIAPGRRSTL
jgi:type VI secretion system protein ImpG